MPGGRSLKLELIKHEADNSVLNVPNSTNGDAKVKANGKSEPGPNCRSSGRKVKKRFVSDPSSEDSKRQRQCEKIGCNDSVPICFASANDRCCGRGYTSRWYHVSLGEHFCNECFDHYYRSHKEGYNEYSVWKRLWSSSGRMEASLKAFMADRVLPYWVRCTLCAKWRQLSRDTNPTPQFIANFKCRTTRTQSSDSTACQVPEDSRVKTVGEPFWISYLQIPALLRDSPASRWLHEYFADAVGLSPTSHFMEHTRDVITNGDHEDNERSLQSCQKFLQPFYQSTEQRKICSFRPDAMETDEIIEFPEFSKDQIRYLGARNLIVALWNEKPQEWLTMERISQHLICRGLSRIRCLLDAERILTFLTKKGTVNSGIVTSPEGFSLGTHHENVVVIGAGASGLAAAKHLQNLGLTVMVLEASSRIGGRVWDEPSFGGSCVGRGAQIVNGLTNNPVSVMCQQLDLKLKVLSENCQYFHKGGVAVSQKSENRIDFHFNAMLDAVTEWRKDQSTDVGLLTKINEMHDRFLEETGLQFSQQENELIQLHQSHLEHSCGSDLDRLSCLHWDQNELFPQFAGDKAFLPFGYSTLLTALARDLDVRLGHAVSSIDYSRNNEVTVTTCGGKTFKAGKVIVTVPLAVLQKGEIEFVPPLPEKKCNALKSLGSGLTEKVALVFPKRFWEDKLGSKDFFGYVPSSSETRGLFNVFYDLTPPKISKKKTSGYVLLSCVSGDALNVIADRSDEEVVSMCMAALRKIFKDKVPDPWSFFVTHWSKEPYTQMAYSFIKVGGTGDAYDHLAEEVHSRLYFAGEATNRQFPQTVTGALLSGVREACKIVNS